MQALKSILMMLASKEAFTLPYKGTAATRKISLFGMLSSVVNIDFKAFKIEKHI